MKIEINVVKMHLVLLIISILIVAGIGLVVGYGTSTPSTLGHTVGELDFTGGFTVPGNVYRIETMNMGSHSPRCSCDTTDGTDCKGEIVTSDSGGSVCYDRVIAGPISFSIKYVAESVKLLSVGEQGSQYIETGMQICIKDQSGCKYLKPMFIDLTSLNDQDSYQCTDVQLEEYCGDFDGCRIWYLLQHETDGSDKMRGLEEWIFMEHPDFSNNKNNGIYGYTRQVGGDYTWITGTTAKYKIFEWPEGWLWMFNYRHDYCPNQDGNSPAYTDPYKFTFMTAKTISARIFIYD